MLNFSSKTFKYGQGIGALFSLECLDPILIVLIGIYSYQPIFVLYIGLCLRLAFICAISTSSNLQ